MTINSNRVSLNFVSTVTATPESGVFILQCNITDVEGNTYDADYCSRPEDVFGLNPTIRRWLIDNTGFPIQPHVPPTTEKIRASMPSLSARQFRLGLLVKAAVSPSQVKAAIDVMPSGMEKEKAQIEWEYAPTFDRMHPLIATITAAVGLAEDDMDIIWMTAADF